MAIRIETPLTEEKARALKSGDSVLLSGTVYTARDAAHKRIVEAMEAGKPLPFDPENAVVYYVGPTPAKPGQAIGSAGPTTSYRMDAYSPALIARGQRGMIGKGKAACAGVTFQRAGDDAVVEAMKQHGAVYFGAIGGAGALLSKCVRTAEVIAYDDLGAEAVRRLTVEDLPLTVVIDSEGNNLYETGREAYLAARQK